MANPQPNEYTRISNELYGAIMQSDFSKRQRNILDLIIRMSYGCGKKSALLRPVDFSVVGVGKNHIKTELDYLKHANVIFIDGEQITLNKDYDNWRVSLVSGYNEERFKEILHKNLQHKREECSSQNENLVPETGTSLKNKVPEMGTTLNYEVPEMGTTLNYEVPEMGTNSTEEVPDLGTSLKNKVPETGTEQIFGSQNRNCAVPKTGTDIAFNPLSGAASQTPKESIKEIDRLIDRQIDRFACVQNFWEQLQQDFIAIFKTDMKPQHYELINGYLNDGMDIQLVLLAMEAAKNYDASYPNYLWKILDTWIAAGVRTFEEYRKFMQKQAEVQARERPRPPKNEKVTSFNKQNSKKSPDSHASKYDVFYQYYSQGDPRTK